MFALSLVGFSIAAGAHAFWEVRRLGGTTGDHCTAAFGGLLLLLLAIVFSLPVDLIAGSTLIFPLVVIEEVGKFIVLKSASRSALGYGTVLWIAAWELLISKAVLVYGISDEATKRWMDDHWPAMAAGALSAYLMHVITARLFYLVPNSGYFLLLAVGIHYVTNWMIEIDDLFAFYAISAGKVLAFLLLLYGLGAPQGDDAKAELEPESAGERIH